MGSKEGEREIGKKEKEDWGRGGKKGSTGNGKTEKRRKEEGKRDSRKDKRKTKE